MKKHGIAIAIIVTYILIFGKIGYCKDYVPIVKNSVLEFDQSITIGDAFDNYEYFSSVNWVNYTTKNKRNVVEVTGVPIWNEAQIQYFREINDLQNIIDAKVEVVVQFVLSKDGSTLNINACGMRGGGNEVAWLDEVVKEGYVDIYTDELLRAVYNNQPHPLNNTRMVICKQKINVKNI